MMDAIINTAPTMSSLEIAELVEVRHDSVRRTIERLAEKGVITLPPLVEVSNPGPGPKTISVYRVGKRDSYVIVAQLSPQFTARLVDRWQELEEQRADPVAMLNDPAAMRGLLLGYTERVIELEGQVADMAPRVEAYDRIATADGSLCITDAAKALQVRPKDLFAYLRLHHWIYRRPGTSHDLGYQAKVQAGYLEHKVKTVTLPDGTERIAEQVRVTPKGLGKLAVIFGKAEAA